MVQRNQTFVKTLTKTDVGKRGADGRKSNQSGVAVPRSQIGAMPELDASQLNPSADFMAIDAEGVRVPLRFIYFNGKTLGVNSRNEYRITGIGEYLRNRNADIGNRLTLTLSGDGNYRMSLDSEESSGAPISRSREMWTVALYMSRFSNRVEQNSSPLPPSRLAVDTWNEAYAVFYSSIAEGRSVVSFGSSLKNARDLFDGHIAGSGRTGWRQENEVRTPQPLTSLAQEVFELWGESAEPILWSQIRNLASSSIRWTPEISSDDADDGSTEPLDDDPAARAIRAVRLRRGQSAFRDRLLQLYGRACAISGWKPEDVLEAAHIEPHSVGGHNSADNGLLLRADLHTLMDAGLLVVEPISLRILLHATLMGTNYEQYAGKNLRDRIDGSTPGQKFLEDRFDLLVRDHRNEFIPIR
jgi:hypothetical protein